ncbi:MAG TPA: hypothetical protein VJ455_06725 [Ignavibacteria bacterium]|nr:hypothetical protein [Ignavibacteria bacterium]
MMGLHDFSISLGSTNSASCDTLLMKARVGKMDIKISEQLVYLLRAAESYSIKDYENSSYYIQKVRINNRYPEYYNLKLLLFIGNYSNLKDLKNTARYFYIVNKVEFIDPYNMKTIRSEIRNNFKKDAFDDALSYYYYYHRRLKLIDEIGFVE